MPLIKLQFQPGIRKDGSRYSSSGGWSDGNKVRFRSGYPEKIGGWQKATNEAFIGTARSIFPWSDLSGNTYLGIGTTFKYYIENGGSLFDITPIRTTKTLTNPFTTTSGSATVAAYSPAHGAVEGDFVTFSGATSVGGLTLNGQYQIVSVPNGNNFSFVAGGAASSSATGGGTVTAAFQINSGLNTVVYGNGWGAGTWGGALLSGTATFTGSITGSTLNVSAVASGTIVVGQLITGTGIATGTYITALSGGTGGVGNYTVGISQTVTSRTMTATQNTGWGDVSTPVASTSNIRLWSQSNFGEDLIINPRDGSIYYWRQNTGTSNRAVSLGSLSGARSVPTQARQIIVSESDRKLITFGCTDLVSGEQDLLLIRWSSTEDVADFLPTESNTAGGFRIPTGAEFVSAIETKQEILVWSDTALHSMRYIGPPYQYGITRVGMTSIAAPNAVAAANDAVFWMGQNGFFFYDGRVNPLPCPVKDHVFLNFNWLQADKVIAGSNLSFNEIWWFYPSANSDEIDRYVAFNYSEQTWHIGTLDRTAWIDRSIEDYPRAAGLDGYIYFHEYGANDGSTNPPSPISSYIESGPVEIQQGDQFGFAWRMIPDVAFRDSSGSSPTVNLILRGEDYPGADWASGQTKSNNTTRTVTLPIELFTEQTYFRLRARSVILRVESTGVDVAWRLGIPRIDVRADGRR